MTAASTPLPCFFSFSLVLSRSSKIFIRMWCIYLFLSSSLARRAIYLPVIEYNKMRRKNSIAKCNFQRAWNWRKGIDRNLDLDNFPLSHPRIKIPSITSPWCVYCVGKDRAVNRWIWNVVKCLRSWERWDKGIDVELNFLPHQHFFFFFPGFFVRGFVIHLGDEIFYLKFSTFFDITGLYFFFADADVIKKETRRAGVSESSKEQKNMFKALFYDDVWCSLLSHFFDVVNWDLD